LLEVAQLHGGHDVQGSVDSAVVAGRAELVPVIGEQPQRDGPVIAAHLTQRPGAQRDHRHRVRVGGVGLAARPGRRLPTQHPDGERTRWPAWPDVGRDWFDATFWCT